MIAAKMTTLKHGGDRKSEKIKGSIDLLMPSVSHSSRRSVLAGMNEQLLTSVLVDLRTEIERSHARRLRCISSRYDSSDLYSDVCIRAWQHRRQCRGQTYEEVRHWVRRICTNCFKTAVATNSCQKRNIDREDARETEYLPARQQSADETIERRDCLESLLQQIPPRQAQAVSMRCIDGSGYDELRDRMGVCIERARCLVCNGLSSLRGLVAYTDVELN